MFPVGGKRTNPVVVGIGLGVLVELPALFAALISGGAGHGDYAAARALFSAPMLLTLLEGDTIGPFSMILLALAHLIAASACFAGTLPNFS